MNMKQFQKWFLLASFWLEVLQNKYQLKNRIK